MPLKLLASAVIALVAVAIALGYFGFSASVEGIRSAFLPQATTTVALESEVLPPAPETQVLPPADPEQPGFSLPDIVIPKFPIAPDLPAPIIAPPPPVTPRPAAPAPSVSPTPVAPAPALPPPAITLPPVIPDPGEEEAEEGSGFPRGALVNILCSAKTSALKKSISGSGVIIDSRGIILTVAHVGHYFLLEDYPSAGSSDCVVRTGDPAKTAYDAKLVYVSPEWVKENADALATARPRGNGENDFALLAITSSLTSRALPSSFSSVPLASSDPDENDRVLIGGYGAEFLSGSQIRDALSPILDAGRIAEVYTFGGNAVDVVSVAGTEAAQSGSSGGGLANASGRLVGLITTSNLSGGTAQRVLYAVTPSHIRASFRADAGTSLDSFLRSSVDDLVEDFEDETRELAAVVWDAIW